VMATTRNELSSTRAHRSGGDPTELSASDGAGARVRQTERVKSRFHPRAVRASVVRTRVRSG
jgi:hypothetical protein